MRARLQTDDSRAFIKDNGRVYGVDFSSAPSLKKPITIAIGRLRISDRRPGDAVYVLESVVGAPTFERFDEFLFHPGPWVAGFDLPFSLPRALIEHYGWPDRWIDFIDWYGAQSRIVLRNEFRKFCDGRPAGSKYVYRATDRPAGSSPAMRWTNPPVAWMTHAGMPRIRRAGLFCPGLSDPALLGNAPRIALEAYPGFTARKVTRSSYKSDEQKKQTPERRLARRHILDALRRNTAGLAVALEVSEPWARRLIRDGSGDALDAVICALQAAHACMLPGYGFPAHVDGLEGWIASVPPANT